VTVFLLLGLLQTLVLASTYERGASEVAETVEDGKEAASEAKGTAEAAREAADEAKETVEQERERLPSEERPDEEA
jgi:hypothetical protein